MLYSYDGTTTQQARNMWNVPQQSASAFTLPLRQVIFMALPPYNLSKLFSIHRPSAEGLSNAAKGFRA